MGVYIYTIRAKTIPVVLPTGETIRANLYSYAYKDNSLPYWDDKERNLEELRRENYHRAANNVFDSDKKPISGYVLVADAGDDLHNALLYGDLQAPSWADTLAFPAKRVVGYLRKVGRKYQVSAESDWEIWNQQVGDQLMKVRRKFLIVDGKPTKLKTEYLYADGVWREEKPEPPVQVA